MVDPEVGDVRGVSDADGFVHYLGANVLNSEASETWARESGLTVTGLTVTGLTTSLSAPSVTPRFRAPGDH